MKPSDVILILLVCVLVILAIFVLAPPVTEKNNLQEELRKAQAEIEELENALKEADSQIDRLKRGEREIIEEVARDKFGLAKEGEVIYQVPRQEENSSRKEE